MPNSRKRHGHPYKKPSEVPASQRTTGHFLWAVLIGAFAAIITFFAAGSNYIAIAIAAIIGGVIGYYIGKNMEKNVR